ncbi:hypothetical protein MRB53_017382 [Persea americana]|uniref:Uncharacterized protein n=1 Tax=Persea americana TaxID=3435 RepID=A0ACC2M505_PERAE|nr:hypothetical protein MRB53_017382 [Persea americana]
MAAAVDVGGGVCGFSGYCSLDGNRTTCLCRNGYTYLDANNTYKGCKENFVLRSCTTDDSVKEPLFGMEEMINTGWLLSDYEHYKLVNENQCTEGCLGDCLCAVAGEKLKERRQQKLKERRLTVDFVLRVLEMSWFGEGYMGIGER